MFGPRSRRATADAAVQNAVSRLRKALGRDGSRPACPATCCTRSGGRSTRVALSGLSTTRARCRRPSGRLLCVTLSRGRGPAPRGPGFRVVPPGRDRASRRAAPDCPRGPARGGDPARSARRRDGRGIRRSSRSTRTRERLCRHLMFALNAGGRQQEALDAYGATRRALDEQWGLEPAPETRALQQMILTHTRRSPSGNRPREQ